MYTINDIKDHGSEERLLSALAIEARRAAYTPYSGFRVGAALLAESGKIYLGCNIENAAYSPTNCAERTAFFKAVSEGERRFSAIAIAGGASELPNDICPPCGVCRQVMREFCHDDFTLILGKSDTEFDVCTLKDLLPLSFSPKDVK